MFEEESDRNFSGLILSEAECFASQPLTKMKTNY